LSRDVRIFWVVCMLVTFSGDVFACTRIVGFFCSAIFIVFFGLKIILFMVAVGVVGSPCAIDVYVVWGLIVFMRSWCSDSGSMCRSAVCLVLSVCWGGVSVLLSNRFSCTIFMVMCTVAVVVCLLE